ncbi:TPA: hypothetical protein DEO28_01885 [Candidatus Dependentiae bacterium]|nr:MAG: hypothetical protein UR14_C0004G0063 [candidate division TM6 bacterium GW2011_GWE2_31_21]KKP52982.1 MAG: hypothetical protein UR43_C0008G0064 [candidate division TM6 bacterium GW2011_GWF2_33_332]HBS47781.1 hypothetical protein [Candidatus Dependentiae bacterium]HBZ73243.1 hypothetical protein [Candidatus Dependentiae bacterium]
MKKEIFYATSNPGKFDEVNRFLKSHVSSSINLKQFDGDLFEHQTTDAKAIAISKAKQAFEILKKPVLVDDAGIYFKCFNNFPGTMTKFILRGIGFEGVFSLLGKNMEAYFLLYMVYIDENNLEVFEGRCDGKIVKPSNFDAPKGLPWDAIFVPDGSDKTYSQIRGSEDEKEFAYRLMALKKFIKWLQSQS